jgi:hypothetical protein
MELTLAIGRRESEWLPTAGTTEDDPRAAARSRIFDKRQRRSRPLHPRRGARDQVGPGSAAMRAGAVAQCVGLLQVARPRGAVRAIWSCESRSSLKRSFSCIRFTRKLLGEIGKKSPRRPTKWPDAYSPDICEVTSRSPLKHAKPKLQNTILQ